MTSRFSVELESPGDLGMFEDLQRYLTYHPNLTRFLFNPAGLTFLVGWVLFVGMCIGWLALLAVNTAVARDTWFVAVAEVTGGREVAIPYGVVELGAPVVLVTGISIIMDLVSTSWIYPLFYVYRERNVGRDNFAGYFFKKMERKAEEHRAFIERYGAVGLYFFMLVPFAINGPLIGAIIGKLAGIRTRFILPTVVLATFTASAIWGALWYAAASRMETFLGRFHGRDWIAAGMVLIIGFVLLSTFVGFLRDLRRYRLIQARRQEIQRRGQVSQTLYAGDAAALATTPAAPASDPMRNDKA